MNKLKAYGAYCSAEQKIIMYLITPAAALVLTGFCVYFSIITEEPAVGMVMQAMLLPFLLIFGEAIVDSLVEAGFYGDKKAKGYVLFQGSEKESEVMKEILAGEAIRRMLLVVLEVIVFSGPFWAKALYGENLASFFGVSVPLLEHSLNAGRLAAMILMNGLATWIAVLITLLFSNISINPLVQIFFTIVGIAVYMLLLGAGALLPVPACILYLVIGAVVSYIKSATMRKKGQRTYVDE